LREEQGDLKGRYHATTQRRDVRKGGELKGKAMGAVPDY